MLLVQHIRDHYDQVLLGLKKRNQVHADATLQQVLALDELRKSSQTQRDQLQAEANTISKEIGILMKEGKTVEATAVRDRSAELKTQIKELEEQHEQAEEELKALLYTLPNVPHEAVPAGKSAEDNEIVLSHGEIPSLPEGKLPHWDLIKKYDIIDFDLGIKIAGAGFPVYKGKGARLQRALINFFLDEAAAAGYKEMQPPIVVNAASGFATGQLPDKEGQMYHATEDDFYLIPTAEVPVTNVYRDTILKDTDLPIKMTAYSPCFRREAGSFGKEVRGLNRVHQFEKVEIIQIVHPDKSDETLNEMVAHVENLLISLGLQYRILRLCGGDMGFAAAITYDFEVYSAAQEKWLEVSSVSNFNNYQTYRMKCRFKDQEGKTQFAHSLNGSSLALPRIYAAIVENYQTETGINLPEVLAPYFGAKQLI